MLNVNQQIGHTMSRDDIYQQYRETVPPFTFDAEVARVFDDMIRRSIPFYTEILRQQVRLIQQHYISGSCIYDLGCSNGNLGIALCHHMGRRPFSMVAVDNSAPMLDKFQERLQKANETDRISLKNQDIRDVVFERCSVVVLNFTLQFLELNQREDLMQRINDGLMAGGALLVCEKLTHNHQAMAAMQQDFYHRFKRDNGYSDLEISQKREALEKILVPETMEHHMARLQRVGFQAVETWFKWFNFAAWVAIK